MTLGRSFLKSGSIVYIFKDDIQVLDEKTGKLLWKEEGNSDAKPALPPNEKFLYMLEDDQVSVYSLAG